MTETESLIKSINDTKRKLVLKIAEDQNLEPGQHCFVNCPLCKGINTLFISRAVINGNYYINCINGDLTIME